FEELRAVGLSAAKARYIHDLAEKVDSGAVDLDRLQRLSDEEVITTLCQVKGIGRWTTEMFLIFSMSRLDVLPVDDLGLRASIQHNYSFDHLPKAAEIRALAEPWQPYRTIATIYFWESLHNTPMSGQLQGERFKARGRPAMQDGHPMASEGATPPLCDRITRAYVAG